MRPLLMLAFVEALSGKKAGDFLNQAVALEIYHNSTLLHDDVMDNSDIRHGKPTVHKKWSVPAAILSGDAMISYASLLMTKGLSDVAAVKVARLFLESQLKVDEGQQLDMDFELRNDVNLNEYEQMILLKTGALFSCASGIGCILAYNGQFPDDKVLKLSLKFGYLFGLVFQLQDDLLDTYGDEKIFGKPVGKDILNDKKTWLSISLLNSNKRTRYVELMASKTQGAEKIEAVKALYDSLELKQKLEKEIDSRLYELSQLTAELEQYMVAGGAELIGNYVESIAGREK